MAFETAPQLGPNLTAIIKDGQAWYDIPGKGKIASPQYLTKTTGSDGKNYIWVKAGGAIAANTQVAISDAGVATSGGTSGYFTQGTAIVSGDSFWARSTAF